MLILAWVTEILSGTAGLRSVLPKAGLAVTVTGPGMMAAAGSAELVGTDRAERGDAADEAGVVEPGIRVVDVCGVVGVENASDADVDSAGAAAGDAPVGPAVELTVTVAGAAEVPEAVHPATSKTKAAAAANPTDVVRALRLISICTILVDQLLHHPNCRRGGNGADRHTAPRRNGRIIPAAGMLVDPHPKRGTPRGPAAPDASPIRMAERLDRVLNRMRIAGYER